MFRSVWKTRNRFLSILAIVAIGTGFFAGIKSSCPDMRITAEKYFQDYALSDIHLVSTFGFNEDDVEAIKQHEGIRGLMPGYSTDVFADIEGNSNTIVKLISLPESRDAQDPNYINRPVLKEGRLPEKPGECVMERTVHTPEEYQVGSKISFHADSETELSDILKRDEFTIVGVVQSPSYITFERGNSPIGDGVVDTFVMIPEEDFCVEVYTDVYMTLNDTAKVSPFDPMYQELVDGHKEGLENLADTRTLARYEEVVDEAQEKIDDAKKELEEGIETQQKELADARQKIADAKKELEDGEQEYWDGLEEFNQQIADAQQELKDAEKDIRDGWKEYNDGWDEYKEGKKEYEEGLREFNESYPEARRQLDEGWKQYHEGMAQLKESEALLEKLKDLREMLELIRASINGEIPPVRIPEEQLDELEKLLPELLPQLIEQIAPDAQISPEELEQMMSSMMSTIRQLVEAYNKWVDMGDARPPVPPAILATVNKVLDELTDKLDEMLAQFEAALEEGRAQLEDARKQLEAGEAQLRNAEKMLEKAKAQLEEAREQLREAEQQLIDGEKELKEGWQTFYREKADGEQKLIDAKLEIEDGKQQLLDAQKEYDEGEAESNAEIEDGRKKIADADAELADLSLPKWYVWDRNNNVDYSGFEDDTEKIDAIAKVFPVFFIMVAALVCLTTMTRMVEEERTQIGTLKALGYSKLDIMTKYMLYAVGASLFGSAIGLAIGFQLFPKVIINTYRMMYIIPEPLTPFRWNYAIICTLAAIACTGISAFVACRKELQSCPAELMRPRAPKAGKRVLLERIPWLWKRLSFIRKVTLRNVFRYKRRVLMTVIGIAGCTALMLTGFGLKYAIGAIVPKQFGEVFRYDGVAALDDVSMREKTETFHAVEELESISEEMMVMQKTMDARSGNNVKSVYLFVPQKPEKMDSYIALRERSSQEHLELTDDTVIINEKLGKLMDWKVGDKVTLLSTDGRPTEAEIGGITENYTFNYVYMTPKLYKSLFRDVPDYNLVMFNMADPQAESKTSEELLAIENLLGVSYTSGGNAKFEDMISSLDAIVWVLIASAGLLAFIVLYNLSNINVNERVRELATIKVLGFYDREVSAYIYRESNISAVIGLLAGLGLGVILEKFVIMTAEVDIVMFAPEIPFTCFLSAAALTIVFTEIVNVILHFKLKKIDMVESMKSVE